MLRFYKAFRKSVPQYEYVAPCCVRVEPLQPMQSGDVLYPSDLDCFRVVGVIIVRFVFDISRAFQGSKSDQWVG